MSRANPFDRPRRRGFLVVTATVAVLAWSGTWTASSADEAESSSATATSATTTAATVSSAVPGAIDTPGRQRGHEIVAAGCAECHSFEASTGDLVDLVNDVGPSLHDAGSRLRRPWVETWLQDPVPIRPLGYLPARYAVATAEGDRVDPELLPSHPKLAPDDAEAVAAYLETLTRPMVPYPPSEPNSAIRASVHFAKILPCGGCHRLDGEGGLSSADLTGASARLQPEWSRSFIWDPQGWGHPLMPKTRLRSDQLLALNDLLMEARDGASAIERAEGTWLAPDDEALPPIPVAQEHRRASRIYRGLCAQCHGVQSNGRGLNAPHLFIAPRDHTSFDEMVRLTDQRIFDTISLGGAAVGKSSLMPSWGAVLEDEDIWLLVAYLRELSGTS